MNKNTTLFLMLLFSPFIYAQEEDLLEEIETTTETGFIPPAFKGLQIVTGQSTKLASKGDLYSVVAHRFGDVSQGFDNFFGLDNASTKIGFIYGLTDNLSLSLSRETLLKTYEGGIKYRIVKQSENFPVEIVGYNVLAVNSDLSKDDYPGLKFSNRLSYLSQALVSRRFSESFSLQFSPSFVHKNLYEPKEEEKDQFLTGLGGRYKLSKRISVNTEYFVNFSNSSIYKNPFSLGLDIETGGHVFQLLFSNSRFNSDIGYLTNASGNWGKGNVFFGFNLYRVF
ncbi:DUF5777 family beta-barrel protein [Chishuiella changwenlii]|uniref:DUF5777 family beta-barrel protein n=1 Tax=Chishuiella changwenlii TaxID=1434701 RepID=UPI002FD92B1F